MRPILFFQAIDLLTQRDHHVLCIGQSTLDLLQPVVESPFSDFLWFGARRAAAVELIDRRGDDDHRCQTREKLPWMVGVECDDPKDASPKPRGRPSEDLWNGHGCLLDALQALSWRRAQELAPPRTYRISGNR